MLGIDLDTVNPDQIDQFQKSGGILPKGKYHVRLDGAKDGNSNGGTPYEELILTALAGPFAGQEIKEKVYKSDKEGAKNRLVLFASRLGLIRRDGSRFVPV